MFSKTLKGRTVVGVAAGRFHTVLWTREAVYTMGLNGGQLGNFSVTVCNGMRAFLVLEKVFRFSTNMDLNFRNHYSFCCALIIRLLAGS